MRRFLILLQWSVLFACSSAFTCLPRTALAYGLVKRTGVLRASADDNEKRLEGIMAFRERQRLRAKGEPLSVWSQGADPADFVEDDGEPAPPIGYTPTTKEQAQAADELFEKLLRDDMPEGFADDLDRFGI